MEKLNSISRNAFEGTDSDFEGTDSDEDEIVSHIVMPLVQRNLRAARVFPEIQPLVTEAFHLKDKGFSDLAIEILVEIKSQDEECMRRLLENTNAHLEFGHPH